MGVFKEKYIKIMYFLLLSRLHFNIVSIYSTDITPKLLHLFTYFYFTFTVATVAFKTQPGSLLGGTSILLPHPVKFSKKKTKESTIETIAYCLKNNDLLSFVPSKNFSGRLKQATINLSKT